MKKKTEEIVNEEMATPNGKLITRGEAIKKTAYIALSAATMMILLSNPQKVQAAETSNGPAAPN